MDTSVEYIKMCEQAVEIQVQWKQGLRSGDLFACESDYPFSDNLHMYVGNIPTHKQWLDRHLIFDEGGMRKAMRVFNTKQYIWLPQQDQLQEIFGELEIYSDVSVYSLFRIMLEHWLDLQEEYGDKISSFEQGWLALVMDEKYGKKWNGETWTKK